MGGSARGEARERHCVGCPRPENAVCITARLGAVDGRRSRCDSVRAARTTGREVEPEAVVATVAARRAGHYFIHALYTLYFTKTHAPRAVRPYHHHHQTRHTRRLLILTGMRLCEVFPRELRYGQRLCRSQCAPAADRPHRVPYGAPPEPSHSVLYTGALLLVKTLNSELRAPHGRGRTDSKSGAHRPARRR
jgi:hypothetical protein